MKKYCIVEKDLHGNHAGTKARNDAAKIFQEEGWQPLCVRHSEEKGIADKLYMVLRCIADWIRVCICVEAGSELCIQYPLAMYPKVSLTAIPFIRILKRKKVRIVYLIHDLDSLRGLSKKTERLFLKEGDIFIVHNEVMLKHLKERGYEDKIMLPLGLFDYLTDIERKRTWVKKDNYDVVIAGNLKMEKAGFIYELDSISDTIQFHVYGPNAVLERLTKNVVYEGQFSPEELPEKLMGHFGLVWDGASTESCSGIFGEYLKYNNPHKASLYIACGMPLIVWNESALAKLAERYQIGLAVSSLKEMENALKTLNDDTYQMMRRNTEKLAEKLKCGMMLKQIIRQIESL